MTTTEAPAFRLEPGTAVAALSFFRGITEVKLSFGDLDIEMITTGTWAEDRYLCENSTDATDQTDSACYVRKAGLITTEGECGAHVAC